MGRPPVYKTAQSEAILSYMISVSGSYVTVEEIARYFADNNIRIGLTTIYRNLDKLVASGKIRKYVIEGEAGACFRYLQETAEQSGHVNLKCEGCGELYPMHCKMLEELGVHVEDEHAFRINPTKIVFYGTCKNCSDIGDENEL